MFTGPALKTTDDETENCPEDSVLTDGVNMGRKRAQRAALVLLDGFWRVQLGEVNVRVHRYQDVSHICLGRCGGGWLVIMHDGFLVVIEIFITVSSFPFPLFVMIIILVFLR